ncbi:MAG: hypothetical protein HY320_16695 [Armatimonadetes bacterium]|nr:hypothetical protein [Armatimonadota bacterium]
MARAIIITTIVLIMGIGAAAAGLWLRRTPSSARGSVLRRPPMLVPQADGSLYDMRLQVAQMEERLEVQERVSRSMRAEVAALTRERDTLREEVASLREELARLRRQVARAASPPKAGNAPANAPSPALPPLPIPEELR